MRTDTQTPTPKPVLIDGELCNPDGTPFKFITIYTSSDEPSIDNHRLLGGTEESYDA